MTEKTLRIDDLVVTYKGPLAASENMTECYHIRAPETLPISFLEVEITHCKGKYRFQAEGDINGYVSSPFEDFLWLFSTQRRALERAKIFFMRMYHLRLGRSPNESPD